MDEDNIFEVSNFLCRCYHWLGEQEQFSHQYIRFLIEERGSIETIRRESVHDTYYMMYHNHEIVGLLSMKDNKITKLYIEPTQHKKGLGRLLFKKAEAIIRQNGYQELQLIAFGDSSLFFYKAMGMKIVERKQHKIEQGAIVEGILLKKSL